MLAERFRQEVVKSKPIFFNQPMRFAKLSTRREFIGTSALAVASVAHGAKSSKWKPIFNGKNTKGWHKPAGKVSHGTGGHWFVEDGALVGEQDPPGSGNGVMHASQAVSLYPNSLIDDRSEFDLQLLHHRTGGLNRPYPLCPNYDHDTVRTLIIRHLDGT